MPHRPLTIWTGVSYPKPYMDLLRQGTEGHRLVFAQKGDFSALAAPMADPGLAEADVAFGQPSPESLLAHPQIKWVHITSAGYTPFDRADLRQAFKSRGAHLTNSSAVYAEPCAQHALALMLSHARQIPTAVENQNSQHVWLYREIREKSVLLGDGQKTLIVGFGAIGTRLAELLAPFRMDITAVRRSPTGREPVKCLPTSQVDDLLPHADHVVNILPLAPGTENFFNAARFARMKPSAVFYNIGRGNTVDQDALRSALVSKQLSAACLDVTTPEPLPPYDPLWKTPNCHITPHTAGGHTTEFPRIVNHFLQNLRRYEKGEPLADRVF
jgi:phosphoglycerate dehydrogenase-like enzyme